MWKAYSWNYIKRNRAAGLPVIAAAFTSALFLTWLGSIFYNLWRYDADAVQVSGPIDMTPLSVFYLIILLLVSAALILIIHNAFAISMDARVHQFGIFSSVGATPGQILICLVQEAAVLGSVPVLLGSFGGILLGYGTIRWANRIGAGLAGRREAVFHFSAPLFAGTVFLAMFTVITSALLPAGKLSRLAPLQAIRGAEELQLKRKRRSSVLTLLFGIEGKLAGNALWAQRKAFRTSTLSLTLSFLSFTVMTCFFTLSAISTRHTYFERYQDAWDIMVTLRDTEIADGQQAEEIGRLAGVRSSIVYQKAEAVCILPEEMFSEELRSLGGLEALTGQIMREGEEGYPAKAAFVVMDDESFAAYCVEIQVEPQYDSVVVLNRIWDSQNSNFRYKEYIPFLQEDVDCIMLQGVVLPVLAYTQTPPVLREAYDDYALVQFLPASLWEQIAGQIGGAEADTYIRLLGREGVTLAELNILQEEIRQTLQGGNVVEIENRIQEKQDDERKRQGFMTLLGAFCALLALIGIANVFSNTLGFLRQRQREFAQYQSVGLTPGGMCRVFAIEALIVAGRPVLITLPLTVAAVAAMIRASYLDPAEFLAEAPVVPIMLFMFSIFAFVGIAYALGARRLLDGQLAGTLRSDIQA